MHNIRQKIAQNSDGFFHNVLQRELQGMNTILDVGCGWDSPLTKISHTAKTTGVDIYKPVLKKAKKRKTHNHFINGDVINLSSLVKNKKFDAVVAFDLIEHLPKKKAIKLINDMEIIAKKKVIILTPNGFTDQEDYDGNPYQKHQSGWTVQQFSEIGYIVYGLRGLKFIRGEHATIRLKPWFIWGGISFLSDPVVYFKPNSAYHLLAVKML